MPLVRTSPRRRALLLSGLAVAALVPFGLNFSANAGGGGGCYEPMTKGHRRIVEIRNYCFTDTVVRVDRGDTVRWVNRDAAEHTVTGANGSFLNYRRLKEGDLTSTTFKERGVYPYFCAYHPGMVAAVVVG
jgi:plastocyanin